MITPAQMPKKVNPIHQQILGSLLANKPRTLAGNVSDENVEIIARRWIA